VKELQANMEIAVTRGLHKLSQNADHLGQLQALSLSQILGIQQLLLGEALLRKLDVGIGLIHLLLMQELLQEVIDEEPVPIRLYEPKMIYSENCCCCIELKCGCILIAIVEVLIRGLDRFFVDRKWVCPINRKCK